MRVQHSALRYRAYAGECLAVAEEVRDARTRLMLLEMAQAWIELADQAEKAATVVVAVAPKTEKT